jgi:hypothetical protein
MFGVALNKQHYRQLLLEHVPPVPSKKGSYSWIKMGFPVKEQADVLSFCSWYGALHEENAIHRRDC